MQDNNPSVVKMPEYPEGEAPKFEASATQAMSAFREMTEKGVTEAKDAYAKMKTAAEETTGVMTDAVTSRSEQIVVRMPHEVLAAVRAEAARRGLSLAGTVTALTAGALGINELDRSRPGARTIPEMTNQEEALAREEAVATETDHFLFYDSIGGILMGQEKELAREAALAMDWNPRGAAFEWALASFGQIADEVDRIIERTGATIATMSARGDRIDRIQAQNRAAIEALLADARR